VFWIKKLEIVDMGVTDLKEEYKRRNESCRGISRVHRVREHRDKKF
jgi:hypothetical protein